VFVTGVPRDFASCKAQMPPTLGLAFPKRPPGRMPTEAAHENGEDKEPNVITVWLTLPNT